MNYKSIQFGEQSRNEMLKGIRVLANAVSATLGPNGRNVVIKRKFNAPHVTKDGVSVAREIKLRDEFADIGASLLLESSLRSNEVAGDGTTTTVVLAHAVVENGIRYIENGVSAIDIKRGIDQAAIKIVEEIKAHAQPINTTEQLIKIATISANSDPVIAKLIADALKEVGNDGIISVEKGGASDELIVKRGMRIDSGWVSAHFLSSPDKLNIELDNPSIILVDKALQKPEEIIDLLNDFVRTKDNGILIAHEFSDEVLTMLAANFKQGIVNVIPVTAPGYGDRRSGILEDLAIYTNADVHDNGSGLTVNRTTERHYGKAGKVTISRDETSFVEGAGSQEKIQERIEHLKLMIESEESNHGKERTQDRIASLGTGAAIIRVGGFTEVEMKEKKDRVDDAICAVRAAIAEGYLVGGGTFLYRLSKALEIPEHLNEDIKLGWKIALKSIQAPFEKILTNAGISPEVIADKLDRADKEVQGTCVYNLISGKVEDLTDTDVIDPAKVTRSAVQNATSIAGLILTTEVVIGWDGEDKTDNLEALSQI